MRCWGCSVCKTTKENRKHRLGTCFSLSRNFSAWKSSSSLFLLLNCCFLNAGVVELGGFVCLFCFVLPAPFSPTSHPYSPPPSSVGGDSGSGMSPQQLPSRSGEGPSRSSEAEEELTVSYPRPLAVRKGILKIEIRKLTIFEFSTCLPDNNIVSG